MNKLENGMFFKSSIEVCKYLGYEECGHSNLNLQRLSHYCDFHRDENKCIYIDNVYDDIIPFKEKGFRYSKGEIVKTKTGEIEIVDLYRKDFYGHNSKAYKCKCNIHNYEFELFEDRIYTMGIGCPLCGKRKLIPGKRSLYDLYPELMKYIVNIEDAKNSTPRNKRKILCKCPNCDSKKKVSVSNLVGYGFSCDICSPGISYPNKFITALLFQIGVEFDTEKVFDWSNGKRYDHYIDSIPLIIENQGEQHYKENNYFHESLRDIETNDIVKKDMAIQHGIKYIEIDCRKSNKNWISNSILSSNLLSLLNVSESDINWDLCDEYGKNDRNKTIWNEWNETQDANYLMKKYGVSQTTIRLCVNEGYKLGKCNTKFCPNDLLGISDDVRERLFITQSQTHSKPIYCVTDDIYFHSKNECYEYYKNLFPNKTRANGLYAFINENRDYKGKRFIYISKEEFNNKKTFAEKNNLNNVFGDYYHQKYVLNERRLK